MTNKYHSDTQEKIEAIGYSPGIQDTGDLEEATKTITATSKPGTADYSKALTLVKPSDVRLVVKWIGTRLEVTRDSGTSSNLYCTVSVDSADGSANKVLDAVDVQAANLQGNSFASGDVFDLLSDGTEHTFYFFFWVDAGDSVISKVELWEAVGRYGTGSVQVLELSHTGWLQFSLLISREGSGSKAVNVSWVGAVYWQTYIIYTSTTVMGQLALVKDGLAVHTQNCTVATDLYYFPYFHAELRSEK